MQFGLIGEFRNPRQWQRPVSAVYEDAIEHLCAAEHLGFKAAEFLEHHFVDDGYLPSPLMAASAVAARTKHMRVATNIAILPLYDPVRFAEATAVLDAISGGRLDVGVAIGYRKAEYEGYRLDLRARGARMDEAVQILRMLWQGDPVTFKGKHFELDRVRVTPRPVQAPSPPLWIGGFTAPGVRRAARYGDGYTGLSDPKTYEIYLDELRKAGKNPASARVRGCHTGFLVASEDPERTFERFAPHVIYWANSYASWFEGSDTRPFSAVTDNDGLRRSNLLQVLTPETIVARLKELERHVPLETYSFLLSPPGLPVGQMFEHIELFAKKVIPEFNR
jgi:alkanesulfonate monooxygenase SsuD/methylene tetrahydromethanopterin reductase-like flavin-dependent oxidoreductase (luciferase family)